MSTGKLKGYVKISMYYTDGEIPKSRPENMFFVLSEEELKALQRLAAKELKGNGGSKK